MDGEINCPFCGEPGEVYADFDEGETGQQVFIQDCAVCCRPWTVRVRVNADGEIEFSVDRA